jgi:hypothetical protein
MDREGWYSVTPENIAVQIAERCTCGFAQYPDMIATDEFSHVQVEVESLSTLFVVSVETL